MSTCSKRILLLAASLFLTFGLMEIGIRGYDWTRGVSPHARTSWYWLFEQDPYLGYKGRPHVSMTLRSDVVHHNDEGFRDNRDLSKLQHIPNKKLVICIGESSTYGWLAGSNDKTYPSLLEQELRLSTKDNNWHVLNAGLPGYTSYEALVSVYLKLIKLKPDYVVMMNLRNDHELMARYVDEKTDYNSLPMRLAPWSSSFLNEWLMRSALVGFTVSRLKLQEHDDFGRSAARLQRNEMISKRALHFYSQNISILSQICREQGITLFCVDQPIQTSRYSQVEQANIEQLRQQLRSICQKEKISLLEANSKFNWSHFKIEDDVHLGAEGYAYLAKLVAEQMMMESKIHKNQ